MQFRVTPFCPKPWVIKEKTLHVKYKIVEWFNVLSKHTPSHSVYQNLCNQLQWRIAVEPGVINWTKLNNKNQSNSAKLQWFDCFAICLAIKHNQAPSVCWVQLPNSVTPTAFNWFHLGQEKKNAQISTSFKYISIMWVPLGCCVSRPH